MNISFEDQSKKAFIVLAKIMYGALLLTLLLVAGIVIAIPVQIAITMLGGS